MRFFFIFSCLTAIIYIFFPIRIKAQCSANGVPVSFGCLGITEIGCCTIKTSVVGVQVTTVQWCENGYLCSLACNPNSPYPVCGWEIDPNTNQGIYDCTVSQSTDPSNQNPYLCQIPCGNISSAGCCEGQSILKYCKDGSLNILNCLGNSDSKYHFCGWDSLSKYYVCTSSATQGPPEFPYSCNTTCVPSCSNKECGTDGCEGNCGTCASSMECHNGKCTQEECVPNCHYKECGSDQCEGSCGFCTSPQVCSSDFKCVYPSTEDTSSNKDASSIDVHQNTPDITLIILCPDGLYNYNGECKQKNYEKSSPASGCGLNLKENSDPRFIIIFLFVFLILIRKAESRLI